MSAEDAPRTYTFSRGPRQNKEDFEQCMSTEVHYYDSEEYKKKFGSLSPFAIFVIPKMTEENGIPTIVNPVIRVDAGAFLVDGEDFSDLIPIIVKHEVEEMWSISKGGRRCTGGNPFRGPSQAHYYALRQQYRFAFALGKAERYIDFQKKSLPIHVFDEKSRKEALQDQLDTYELIKSRQRIS